MVIQAILTRRPVYQVFLLEDYYEEVHFYVYKDDNTLKQVDMRNFVEPEGYDKGSVSEEVPEIVSSPAPLLLSWEMICWLHS